MWHLRLCYLALAAAISVVVLMQTMPEGGVATVDAASPGIQLDSPDAQHEGPSARREAAVMATLPQTEAVSADPPSREPVDEATLLGDGPSTFGLAPYLLAAMCFALLMAPLGVASMLRRPRFEHSDRAVAPIPY